MDDKTAFHPEPVSTVALAASDVTGNVELVGAAGPSRSVRVVNKGTSDAFIAFGDATVVATETTTLAAGSMLIPANQTEIFQIGSATHMAAITAAAGAATLYATSGVGL